MRPERLVLYRYERVLEIVRQLIVLGYLTVLGIEYVVCQVALVIINMRTDIQRIHDLVRVDVRSLGYRYGNIRAAGDSAYDHQGEQYLEDGQYPSELASLFRRLFLFALQSRYLYACLGACLGALLRGDRLRLGRAVLICYGLRLLACLDFFLCGRLGIRLSI